MITLAQAERFAPGGFKSVRTFRGPISIHPTSVYRHELREAGGRDGRLTVAIWSCPDDLRTWFESAGPEVSASARALIRAMGPSDMGYAIGRAPPSVLEMEGVRTLRFEFEQELVVRGGGGCELYPQRHVHHYARVEEGIAGLLLTELATPSQGETTSRAQALWAQLLLGT